jgi:hypothetical protein
MVVHVEVRQVIVTILQDDENLVTIVEFTEQVSVLIIIQAVDIRVIPHHPSA